ncbi:DUF6504 family protein [Kineosporia sp. A_224]|uniref:DUF6504 family protein n=1 Tax=Kineosporia sp. A_224 TaxID=1962180 RepID=UPI000B4B7080|nr:DUF6504 family protein [Kineosporia sp. A_224]
MVRRYEEPVEVRPAPDGERPGSFLWHGRLYVVRDVLGHWRERRAWWASAAARAVHGDGDEHGPGGAGPGTGPGVVPREGDEHEGDEQEVRGPRVALAPEREVWRVEASRGRVHGTGVFDLCREGARADGWRLVRVAD